MRTCVCVNACVCVCLWVCVYTLLASLLTQVSFSLQELLQAVKRGLGEGSPAHNPMVSSWCWEPMSNGHQITCFPKIRTFAYTGAIKILIWFIYFNSRMDQSPRRVNVSRILIVIVIFI